MTARAHRRPTLTDTAGDQVRDMIADLTRTRSHREPYTVARGKTTWARDHVTSVPSLLWQLEHSTPTKSSDDNTPGGFRSQPAAWLEAIDTLARIDLEASRWVTDMGEKDDGTTTQVVIKLGGLLPSAHRCHRHHGVLDKDATPPASGWCCTWHAVEHDVRRWHTQALVVTGWQSPAWRPDSTCPMCGHRGGLRVRLSERSAVCIECHETWGPNMIGLLAEHIRAENREQVVGQQG